MSAFKGSNEMASHGGCYLYMKRQRLRVIVEQFRGVDSQWPVCVCTIKPWEPFETIAGKPVGNNRPTHPYVKAHTARGDEQLGGFFLKGFPLSLLCEQKGARPLFRRDGNMCVYVPPSLLSSTILSLTIGL